MAFRQGQTDNAAGAARSNDADSATACGLAGLNSAKAADFAAFAIALASAKCFPYRLAEGAAIGGSKQPILRAPRVDHGFGQSRLDSLAPFRDERPGNFLCHRRQ